VRPFFSDKYDITKHTQYRLLSDYDKKNEFDIEKYVRNRNRLLVKKDAYVDEVCDVGEITA
jgi:type IV secretion system protein VirD4